MAFAAVSGLVFVAGQYVAREIRLQQRIAAPVGERRRRRGGLMGLDAVITKYFDEKRFNVGGSARTKLRQELIRAGFFDPNALNHYISRAPGCGRRPSGHRVSRRQRRALRQGALIAFLMVAIATFVAVPDPTPTRAAAAQIAR